MCQTSHQATSTTSTTVPTLTEAAAATGAARRTLRRRLDAGAFPHKRRADGSQGPGTGPVLVPVGDLLAAGFSVDGVCSPANRATPTPRPSTTVTATTPSPASVYRTAARRPFRGAGTKPRAELDEWRLRALSAEAAAAGPWDPHQSSSRNGSPSPGLEPGPAPVSEAERVSRTEFLRRLVGLRRCFYSGGNGNLNAPRVERLRGRLNEALRRSGHQRKLHIFQSAPTVLSTTAQPCIVALPLGVCGKTMR